MAEEVSFKRTCDSLLHLYERVEVRKKWCDRVCRDSKQLLKPWPRKIFETGTSGDKKVAEDIAEKQEDSGNRMTAEELEDLRTIEKALNKAHKVAQAFQAKYDEHDGKSSSEITPKYINASKKSDSSVKLQMPSANNQRIPEELESKACVGTTSHGRQRNIPETSSGCRRPMQYKHDQKDKGSFKSNSPSADVAVISQAALENLRTSALSNSKNSKPLNAKMPDSVKYRPAHVTAPFKTTSEVSSTGRLSATRRAANRQQPLLSSSSHNARPASHVSNMQNRDGLKKVGSAIHRDNKLVKVRANLCRSSLLPDVASDFTPLPRVFPNDASYLLSNVPPTEEKFDSANDETRSGKTLETNRGSKGRVCQNHVNKVEGGANVAEACFDLRKDGSSLKLPSELSRALSINYKLHETLRSSFSKVPRKLREGESSSENFVYLLGKHIEDQSPEVISKMRLYNHTSNLCNWLKSLLDTIIDIEISDETPIDVIIEAHAVFEFVLKEIADIENIVQSLPAEASYERLDFGVVRKEKNCISRWFDSSLDTDEIHRGNFEESSVIVYQKVDQLISYATLIHEMQVLQLQIFFLEEAGNQALSFLKQLDPSESVYPRVYRSIHSLICSMGQSFPVIVQNLENEIEGHSFKESEDD